VPGTEGGGDRPSSVLSLTTERSETRVLVTGVGQLDIATAPLLREELVDVFVRGAPAHLIVDLAGVEYADSTGLGVLVGARRRVAAEGGRMSVVANDRVARVMRLSGLDQLWRIVDALDDTLDDEA
jgi:anti-sigma B factor antagonist